MWDYRAIRTRLGVASIEDQTKIAGLPVNMLRDVESVLNELGKDGWELVAGFPADSEVWLAFKRPAKEQTP